MTFASLSEATRQSRRIFNSTQNSLNLIQNSLVSKEIHNQGFKNESFENIRFINFIIGETTFCWAFAISSMIRQSLGVFLTHLRQQAVIDSVRRPLNAAHIHLISQEFHKKLR